MSYLDASSSGGACATAGGHGSESSLRDAPLVGALPPWNLDDATARVGAAMQAGLDHERQHALNLAASREGGGSPQSKPGPTHKLPVQAQFCDACDVSQPLRCPSCAAELPALMEARRTRFCMDCGASVAAAPRAPSPAAAAASSGGSLSHASALPAAPAFGATPLNGPTGPTRPEATAAAPREDGTRGGRWSREEHERFLRAIVEHGHAWVIIASVIGTRTPTQVVGGAKT